MSISPKVVKLEAREMKAEQLIMKSQRGGVSKQHCSFLLLIIVVFSFRFIVLLLLILSHDNVFCTFFICRYKVILNETGKNANNYIITIVIICSTNCILYT